MDHPCNDCANYDPIVGRESKLTGFGHCVPRSIYPFKEGPGQTFPKDATRVTSPTGLPKLEVVRATEVKPACPLFRSKE